jgi:hypothetical protein
MTNLKTIIGLLVAAVAVVGVVAFGATQAYASSAPIVIPYEKTCVGTVCSGSAGEDHTGTIDMQITSFRETGGGGAQLTLTEEITLGGISFTAEMSGHMSPAGFIVLNGTVTEGSFVGAQVHQRSDFDGGNQQATHWIGKLRLMPASA